MVDPLRLIHPTDDAGRIAMRPCAVA